VPVPAAVAAGTGRLATHEGPVDALGIGSFGPVDLARGVKPAD